MYVYNWKGNLMDQDKERDLYSRQEVAIHNDKVEKLTDLIGGINCRALGLYKIPENFKLSVVIPVYNEKRWITEVLRRVRSVPIPKEIILVDDLSTDGTREMLPQFADENTKILYKETNQGKGAALRDGFKLCSGDVIIIQDADLEYDPDDYPSLLQPIIENKADIVFGSRFIGEKHRVLYFWHMVTNKILTVLSNMLTNLNLTDMETCYKVFKKEVLDGMVLKSNRFGFEPEFTAKIAKQKNPAWRIFEVPVSYDGRTYEQGKKIGLKDGFNALYCIVRYKFFN
jgi:glycosyltransferase involved in cell wall biosynthesis